MGAITRLFRKVAKAVITELAPKPRRKRKRDDDTRGLFKRLALKILAPRRKPFSRFGISTVSRPPPRLTKRSGFYSVNAIAKTLFRKATRTRLFITTIQPIFPRACDRVRKHILEQPKPRKIPVVVWAPFFDRAKFRYWKNIGRGAVIIGKDGNPRTEFYFDAHVTGGSIWARVFPEGEAPEGRPDDAEDQPNRPAKPGQDEITEEDI